MIYFEITYDDETWTGFRVRDYDALARLLTDQWNDGERFERIDFVDNPPPARPPRGCDFLPYGQRLRAGDFLWHHGRRGRWHEIPPDDRHWIGYEHHFGGGDPVLDRHGRFAARRRIDNTAAPAV